MKNLLFITLFVFSAAVAFGQFVPSGANIVNNNPAGSVLVNTSSGGFSPGFYVTKTNNSFDGKNVAIFQGDASNPANIDENVTVGVVQATNQDGNFGLVNFFNANFNLQGFLGIRYQSHNANQTEFIFGTADGGLATTKMTIRPDGSVGIGTPLSSNPNGYLLAVNGLIGSKEVKVENTSATWPDYVFESDYELPTLDQLELYVQENKHLPGIPSAQEVEEEGGFMLGEMNRKLLEKVEELTLYLIDANKKNEELQQKVDELTQRIEALENQ